MQAKQGTAKRALPRTSLHHSVAQDIGARILKGEFAPSSLLPNEAEWCAAYGVSRTAVREAIKMLIAKGLVLSRPKIGSRVQPRNRWNLLDRDVLVWYCAATDRRRLSTDMQQVRQILEPEAAALAATHRSAAQLREIEDALGGMRLARSREAWNASDVRFHLAILTATGNELLIPLGCAIESALSMMFDYTARKIERYNRALPLHERIFAAIRDGKAAAARRTTLQLLADTNVLIGLPRPRGRVPAGKAKGSKRDG